MRRLSAAIALLLVVTVSTSVYASCMADMDMAESAQMACCDHGHDKCPMHGTPKSCCEGESQRHHQLTTATHELAGSVVNPPALLSTVVPVAPAPATVRLSHLSSANDVLKGPDPPPYLLGSAFLV